MPSKIEAWLTLSIGIEASLAQPVFPLPCRSPAGRCRSPAGVIG